MRRFPSIHEYVRRWNKGWILYLLSFFTRRCPMQRRCTFSFPATTPWTAGAIDGPAEYNCTQCALLMAFLTWADPRRMSNARSVSAIFFFENMRVPFVNNTHRKKVLQGANRSSQNLQWKPAILPFFFSCYYRCYYRQRWVREAIRYLTGHCSDLSVSSGHLLDPCPQTSLRPHQALCLTERQRCCSGLPYLSVDWSFFFFSWTQTKKIWSLSHHEHSK